MQAPSGQRAQCGHGDADHWPHPERAARHHQVYHHLKLDKLVPEAKVVSKYRHCKQYRNP